MQSIAKMMDTAVEHSVPTMCFPTAVSTASSFDTSLMAEMGRLLLRNV